MFCCISILLDIIETVHAGKMITSQMLEKIWIYCVSINDQNSVIRFVLGLVLKLARLGCAGIVGQIS